MRRQVRAQPSISFLLSQAHHSFRCAWVTGVVGGFGAHPKHDAHALTTLSAIQILLMQDAAHLLDVERLTTCELFSSLPSPSIIPSSLPFPFPAHFVPLRSYLQSSSPFKPPPEPSPATNGAKPTPVSSTSPFQLSRFWGRWIGWIGRRRLGG